MSRKMTWGYEILDDVWNVHVTRTENSKETNFQFHPLFFLFGNMLELYLEDREMVPFLYFSLSDDCEDKKT